MDIQDFDSPLRGVMNSPVKRITPAVPVPDWLNSSPGRPIPSPVFARGATPSLLAKEKGSRQSCIQPNLSFSPSDANSFRSSVISCSNTGDTFESVQKEFKNSEALRTSVPDAAFVRNSSNSCDSSNFNSDGLPHTPGHSKISGDIAFTPTHSAFTPSHGSQNPHATLAAQTPIASGPDQAKSSIKLQNCVSTVNLCCELKLLDIYCRTRFSEYNPSRFHGVVMRILEPRATALVFRSGKLVCTGAKNEHDSLFAARKFSRIIQKLGYPVQFTEFKIQNFVATADLRFPVRLEALQQAHGQFTSYEPELFPGLVYRLVRPRIVLLIFVNGKIVFTGGKSKNDIVESLNIIYPILRSFKKN